MKFFANKKNIQKIVIMILLIMSFNFVVPKKVQALDISNFIVDPFTALLATLGDAVFNGLQIFMLGNENGENFFMVDQEERDHYYAPSDNPATTIELKSTDYSGAFWGLQWFKIPVIRYTPEAIFANKVPVLDANFLKSNVRSLPTDTGERNTMMELRNIVAGWYVAIRMMAIVGLLSVLVYLSIRMLMSGIAADKAKYKKMFMDWLVAMCLLFFLHYIMSFAQSISETLVSMIGSAGENTINMEVGRIHFSTNLIGLVRFRVQSDNVFEKITYLIIYMMMVWYTVKFTWLYLKRMLTMAFLTLIAPMVALTYPIDKVGDGKAQAFDMWVKEYTYNTLVQPLHCLIYTIFSVATVSIAGTNPLLAIVIFPCMSYAEKFLKQMLGFNKASGGSIPGLATQVGAHALGTVIGNLGKAGKGGGKSAQGKVRTNDASGKRIADRDAPKNLDGFEASAASGEALDFGDNQEFGAGEEEKQKLALANGQGQADGQLIAQGENPDLTEQQHDWQKNNTEIDSNDAEIMNQMQGIIDDPDASEEDIAMAQDELGYYNDKYGLTGPQEASENDLELMRQMQEIANDPNASEADRAMAKEQLDYYNNKFGLAESIQPADEPIQVTEGYIDTKKEKKPIKGFVSNPYVREGMAIGKATLAAGGKVVYKVAKGTTSAVVRATPSVLAGMAAYSATAVATGDPGKALGLGITAATGTYRGLGRVQDATVGKIGGKIEERLGISGSIKDTFNKNRYGSEIDARNAKLDKKFENSKEFNEYLNYYYSDSKKRAAAKDAFMYYRKYGITDLDEIRKVYKTEEKINKDPSKVGGRRVTREEMVNTYQLSKRLDTRTFTDKKVYNIEKNRVANELFNGNVKNKEQEARRVMAVLQQYRNNN